jgi:hypothetical protein
MSAHFASIGSDMPQADKTERAKEADFPAPSIVNGSGLLGHLSGLLVALLSKPLPHSQESADHERPPISSETGRSFKNNRPAPSQGQFDLARGRKYPGRLHSLDNMLSHRPAGPRSMTDGAAAPPTTSAVIWESVSPEAPKPCRPGSSRLPAAGR